MIYGKQIELTIQAVDGRTKTFLSGFEEEDNFDIEFTVEFGKGFSVKVYNVVRETFLMCEKKGSEFSKLELYAGYKQGYEPKLIASGNILTYQYKQVNLDKVLELKGVFSVKEFYEKVEPRTFYDFTVSAILKSILERSSLKYKINLTKDSLLSQYTSTGNLKTDLDKLCKLVDAVHYVSKGTLYIEPESFKRFKSNFIIHLDRESGLIGSPEIENLKLKAKCLLNPEIALGEIIRIRYRDNANDKEVEGEYKVIGGKHIASLNQFITEFEGLKV